MEHAGVVAALMRRDSSFLLEDCDAYVRARPEHSHCGGETDEPRADDDDIELVH